MTINNEKQFVTVGKGEDKHPIPVDYMEKGKDKKSPYLQTKKEYESKLSETAKQTFKSSHKNFIIDAVLKGQLSPEKANKLHSKDYPELDFNKIKKDYETEQKRIKEQKQEIEKRQQEIEKRKQEIKETEEKEEQDKRKENLRKSQEQAKTETLEEYLTRLGVKARRGSIYELHKYDWEKVHGIAQNSYILQSQRLELGNKY